MVRIFAFDVNDEIVTIDPGRPYIWTWRVITTKVPLFRGVTGSLIIVDGPGGKDTCTIKCVGCFDNRVPACMIQFVLKFVEMLFERAMQAQPRLRRRSQSRR